MYFDIIYIFLKTNLQTNDLQLVHRGVKFSYLFSFQEIEQRWKSLLYDPAISSVALSAIEKLHPETVAKIESKVLFSIDEENLLATIRSVCLAI